MIGVWHCLCCGKWILSMQLCISDERRSKGCFGCSVCRMTRCNNSEMNSLHLLDNRTFPWFTSTWKRSGKKRFIRERKYSNKFTFPGTSQIIFLLRFYVSQLPSFVFRCFKTFFKVYFNDLMSPNKWHDEEPWNGNQSKPTSIKGEHNRHNSVCVTWGLCVTSGLKLKGV